MARITNFFRTSVRSQPHPTEVECGYQTVTVTGGALLQLSTYGSDDRHSEKKVSQTLQLDRQRAGELIEIVRGVFPDL